MWKFRFDYIWGFFSHNLDRVGNWLRGWISLWIFFLFNLTGTQSRKFLLSNRFEIGLFNFKLWFYQLEAESHKTLAHCCSSHTELQLLVIHCSAAHWHAVGIVVCLRFLVVKNTWPFCFCHNLCSSSFWITWSAIQIFGSTWLPAHDFQTRLWKEIEQSPFGSWLP